MHHDNLFYVFHVHPHTDGDVQHRLLGKFWLKDGDFHVLEDHGMYPGVDLEQETPKRASDIIRRMAKSSHRIVVSATQLKEGRHPELLPSIDKQGPLPHELRAAIQKQMQKEDEKGPRQSSFQYHRHGMPAPQILKMLGTKAWLDGHPIEPDELKTVLSNVHEGKATLRHHQEGLNKNDESALRMFSLISEGVKNGDLDPSHLEKVKKDFFQDTLLPEFGNRAAYKQHLSENKPTAHIHLNLPGVSVLNAEHGLLAGNQAIVAAGRAVKQASDETIGKHARLFRPGGDTFVVTAKPGEHVATFGRMLRSKLEAIPALKGNYRLAVAMGAGSNPDEADYATSAAKNRMQAKGEPWGQTTSDVELHPSVKTPP